MAYDYISRGKAKENGYTVKPQTLPIIKSNKTANQINKQVENMPFVTA